jgi:multicomponent Na+:H+ antiporter subunit D
MNIISTHFPALQILIPLIGALFATLSFNRFISWLIAAISAFLLLILSIYAFSLTKAVPIFYAFGNWQAPIGIEYRLDTLNQPIIIFINAVLLFFLLFGKELINSTITNYIETEKEHLFYSLLLFAHVGYLGVISTNDLFNIYVFIEISSLATYVLMSKGKSPKALVGAFDYLMIGTIGATLILIGIGFLFALTGSLNISDVANILPKLDNSRLIITAISFFMTGAILKMAFFPMHFWMVRAYNSTAPFVLTYLAAISSIFGVYIILRFIYFTIDNEVILHNLFSILRAIAMITIIVCSFLALRARDFKKVIIYSTSSQIGYIFLLITIPASRQLLLQLLVIDAINKIALFTIVAHIQNKKADLSFAHFVHIEKNPLFKTLVAFSLLFSAGMPLSAMFLIKINMFDLLISQNLLLEFVVVILGSSLALLYHLRLVKAIFFSSKHNQIIIIDTKLYGLIAIILIQIILLIYMNDIAMLAVGAESIIVN